MDGETPGNQGQCVEQKEGTLKHSLYPKPCWRGSAFFAAKLVGCVQDLNISPLLPPLDDWSLRSQSG
jgi:hypothetical protein